MTKILIVDDSMFQLNMVSGFLAELGYDVTSCNKSTDAMGMLDDGQYDCVFTDLLMPDLDGTQLLALVKAKYPELPVVVLTSNVQKTSETKCRSLGASFFLNKPVSKDTLAPVLSQLFNGG